MTLVELVVVLVLISSLMLAINSGGLFFISQIYANIERQQIHTEIDYALEDMKLRCISAIDTATTFPASGSSSNASLQFVGEKDIYTINPDAYIPPGMSGHPGTTKKWYKYYVDTTDKNLYLRTCLNSTCNSGPQEILVEAKYNPVLTFKYTHASPIYDEPNFITVEISATSIHTPVGCDAVLKKSDGIRLWFIDLAR